MWFCNWNIIEYLLAEILSVYHVMKMNVWIGSWRNTYLQFLAWNLLSTKLKQKISQNLQVENHWAFLVCDVIIQPLKKPLSLSRLSVRDKWVNFRIKQKPMNSTKAVSELFSSCEFQKLINYVGTGKILQFFNWINEKQLSDLIKTKAF